MKRVVIPFIFLLAAALACADFNPPPLAFTPPPVIASKLPVVVLATPSFTPAPATSTPVPPTETQTVPPPTETLTAVPSATMAPLNLTVEQLRNATITYTGTDGRTRTVTLTDGNYVSGTDNSQPGYVRIHLGEKIAFGDLNDDGFEDAVIVLVENYGGSGEFLSAAAVLNQDGNPGAVYTEFIDDRPRINELSIKDGELFMDTVIHGAADPLCCPALPSKRFLRLVDQMLITTRLTTTPQGGLERSIRIESPIDGAEINGPFIVKGSVSVSPFENTLVYSVFVLGATDPAKKAGFTISGDGLGGPGTFELALDPAVLDLHGPVRIEIADLSPADGATQALASVFVVFK